ncbi:rod shape-determining protein MreD [Alcaligenes endophyticus]|uniref:Rod shape-determining protein MreD n=1 Tax=Alcaligenes endophyticus TaxID=1929088 RepID=A0ABT8ELT2_9BURK|nr:rod shape-determining protein MreD [Alcaligenes endophyticus]MCX5591165.1 rod shape-determining protein MreD [Alcaligenes endophyticus]MDN4122257.1 rod shape-determining protein MreD [Alcaligenes endophyticus]
MVSKSSKQASPNKLRRSQLSDLQPIDSQPFLRECHPLWVWGSLFVTWMISLLPWRLWIYAPDMLLLMLAFWAVHAPHRVPLSLAFVLGLLMDVHDGAMLGEHSLTYVIVVFGARVLRKRMLQFNVWTHVLHMLPIFLFAQLVGRLAHAWVAGEWGGWSWVGATLLTLAIWPLVDILMFLPQRRLDDADAGSS